MSQEIRISPEALNSIDQAVIQFRKRILSDCRSLALESDNLIDEATVAQVRAALVHDSDQELNNHGKRRAA